MANNFFVRTYNNREDIINNERIFINNPVIFKGLGLAPVIIAGRTLDDAAVIGLAVFLLLIFTRIGAAVVNILVNTKFRGPLYVITAGISYIAMFFILNRFLGIAELLQFHLYLPVLIMDPIIIKRYERKTREPIPKAITKGIRTALGFAVVIMLIGTIREFLAYGSINDVIIMSEPLFPMARLASGGFIITGMVAAIWKYIVTMFWMTIVRGARHSL